MIDSCHKGLVRGPAILQVQYCLALHQHVRRSWRNERRLAIVSTHIPYEGRDNGFGDTMVKVVLRPTTREPLLRA